MICIECGAILTDEEYHYYETRCETCEGNWLDAIEEWRHGVEIRKDHKPHGHYEAVGAQCHCGMDLMVAPALFHADHRKGDPVMVCADQGVHAYRFKGLVLGKQPEQAR